MKKRIVIGFIVIAVLSGSFLIYRYAQFILVWQVNPGIHADGVKLMMTEDKIRDVLGKEEEYTPGFGCYMFRYQSKGISLSFLNDTDTDFYCKVNRIEITDEKYEIFQVRVGEDYEKALDTIQRNGFTRQEKGVSGYWKNNAYVMLEEEDGKVGRIAIGVKDRVASTRMY